MAGWSGGVYTRFRNWVTDKANSVNPQASLFDQEDDGFAAGLNNCVTKDGLNKPSSPMDWNGQNLTGVLNFASTGTLSLLNGKLTGNLAGNISMGAPTGGVALTITTAQTAVDAFDVFNTSSGSGNNRLGSFTNGTDADFNINITQVGAASKFVLIGPSVSIPLNLTVGGSIRAVVNGSNATSLQANDDAGTLQTVGWRDLPQVSSSANYTFVISDRGKHLALLGPATTATIPANASVAFPVGTVLTGLNATGGSMSVAITTDTMTLAGTASTGTRTVVANGLFTALKTGTTSWVISGPGVS